MTTIIVVFILLVVAAVTVIAVRWYKRYWESVSEFAKQCREARDKINQLTNEQAKTEAEKLLGNSEAFECVLATSIFERDDLHPSICELFSKYAKIEGLNDEAVLDIEEIQPYQINHEYTIIGRAFDADVMVKGQEEMVYECGSDHRVEEADWSEVFPTIYHWILDNGPE